MRTIRHRSLIVALALTASISAWAAPKAGKGGGKGSGSGSGSAAAPAGGGDSGEIEMDDAAAKGNVKAKAGGGGGSGAKGAGAGGGGAVDSGEIQMDDENTKPSDLSADLAATDAANQAVKVGPIKKTPIAWKDIVVVVRKPFLKVRRTELYPFTSTTMNDNMIRHYAIGGELAYYLTDVLAIGVEGQYFVHAFTEAYDLVARQSRRLPTVNDYKWAAALDFHYVPVYGKFAVLDHRLITWESYFTAGIGAGQSEVVPRDPKYPGFSNLLIQPNLGVNMRFFLAKWLTVNVGVRDYLFIDKFEPVNRSMGVNDTAASAKANADSAFINNIMFQIGVSFWIPASFEYTTFR